MSETLNPASDSGAGRGFVEAVAYEAALAEIKRRRAVEAELRALHVRFLSAYDSGYCDACDRPWPCPTVRILDGQQ